jgi:hypothetical protein
VSASVNSGRTRAGHFKDDGLARLAAAANVAQFVSFAPGTEPELRHSRLFGDPLLTDVDTETAIDLLLERSIEGSVNVRSFEPEQPKSHDFIYGIRSVAEAAESVRRLAAAGLYTIVNETVDVNDGGVSGVASGGVVEFAPGDTPRCVESSGTAALPRALADALFKTVYGFMPDIPRSLNLRTEFSLHPLKRGYRNGHTIVWEEEEVEPIELHAALAWPNRFSRFIGDKTFGLLIADALGAAVPLVTVIARQVAPFTFGASTNTNEYWIRTAPFEQVPGRFTTKRGWQDPFRLLADEDPSGEAIASVLAQEGVDAAFSGAAVDTVGGELIIEGVAGVGDEFMQGRIAPEQLPTPLLNEVRRVRDALSPQLGAVRFEWAYDGERVWVLQLHRGATSSTGNTVYPGTPESERRFSTEDGLEALRQLIEEIDAPREGIVLVGDIGITSHFGDVLRRARVPSRITTA